MGPVAVATQNLAPSFTMALRRADNVPLGLDVARGEPGTDYLVVEAVRPGGAVEAWNRQCAGDTREIRRGDRITMINGKQDADAMREQCLQKHLLRMTVARHVVEHGATGAAPESASFPVSPSNVSLRAEAHEFVPRTEGRTWGSC